jgi:putative DNA primase/helicase
MLRCALTEPDLRADLEEFDADPYLLSCTNGTVDLRTGELREHRREDKITQLCPCLYDPAREGTSATWEAALDVWTGGDGELKRFLRQVGGLAATGCSRDERFLLFLGPTATGKSSFLNALLFTLGPDLAMTVPFDTWLRRPMTGTGRPRDDLAMLRAFRFVIALEAAEGSQLDEGTLKSFVGGDQITARGLYATEHLSFVPRATVCLSCNDMPIIRDTDAAMWRRLLTVPFGHTIPDAQRDPRVKAELTNPKVSGPAILAWMVAGAVDWYANGLVIPEAVQSATRTQQGAMDRLAEFLEAVCVRSPGATVTREALYKAYREWAEGAGLREAGASGPRVALTAQEFVERLRLQGLTEARRGKGRARAWVGIGLLADGQEALNMGD